ncbi:hypothetical protein OTU49_014525, partial [Cherax quadricarinatus]
SLPPPPHSCCSLPTSPSPFLLFSPSLPLPILAVLSLPPPPSPSPFLLFSPYLPLPILAVLSLPPPPHSYLPPRDIKNNNITSLQTSKSQIRSCLFNKDVKYL